MNELAVPDSKLLLVLKESKKFLAEVEDIAEILRFKNGAAGFHKAWEGYYKASGQGFDQMFTGWEAKIRAERRMGELLDKMELAKGGEQYHSTGNTMLPVVDTLDELGISKMQSSRYQKLLQIAESIFDDEIENMRGGFIEPTTSRIMKLLLEIRDESDRNEVGVSYGENMYFRSATPTGRWDDHIIEGDTYPTLTRLSRFFHKDRKEFSLREYARVQDFPDSYKFVGTYSTIKGQIGNAVSPKMARFIGQKLKGKTFVDLFAGCGGLSCGLESLDKQAVFAVEYEPSYFITYRVNFPDVPYFQGDIRSLDVKTLPDADIVVGGPPCQGFSTAGLRLKEDPRNVLYQEFLRVVKHVKPKEFLMENVPEIKAKKEQIIKDFDEIGYSAMFQIVHGPDIGMKQTRTRAFFIGVRR